MKIRGRKNIFIYINKLMYNNEYAKQTNKHQII